MNNEDKKLVQKYMKISKVKIFENIKNFLQKLFLDFQLLNKQNLILKMEEYIFLYLEI